MANVFAWVVAAVDSIEEMQVRGQQAITVLLVDDHELVRAGISRILADAKGIKVVGEAASGEQAVAFCRQNSPDVVLMDIQMPGIGGLSATQKILRQCPEVRVLALSVSFEEPTPTRVMQSGAAGFLSKNAPSEEMIDAIRKVAQGERYLSVEVAQRMAMSKIVSNNDNPFAELSDREMQIMRMITMGAKVADIAEQLNVSAKTVNSYRYRMFTKLDIDSDVALTHLALRHNMIDLG